jgi:hypothetical protein
MNLVTMGMNRLPDTSPINDNGPTFLSVITGLGAALTGAMAYLYRLLNNTRTEALKAAEEAAKKVEDDASKALDRHETAMRDMRREFLDAVTDLYNKFNEGREAAAKAHTAMLDRLDVHGRLIVAQPTRADLDALRNEMKTDGREREARLMDAIKSLDKRKQDKGNGSGSGD